MSTAKTRKCSHRALRVAVHSPARACGTSPVKASLHHTAPRQQYKAFLRLGQLHDLQINAVAPRRFGRRLTHLILVRPCQLDRVARGSLHCFAQLVHLRALLFVGWLNMHRQQVVQRVHGHVNLAAALAFVAVIACAWATLASRLQRSPGHHHGAGLALAPLGYADDGAKILNNPHPATGGSADGPPPRAPREADHIGQHPPGRSRAHQPAQGVEDFAQIVLALGRVLVHQGQVGAMKLHSSSLTSVG